MTLEQVSFEGNFSPSIVGPLLAEREAAGVNVHLGDADEPQRRREPESRGDWTLEQQVRQLVALLEAKGGVVEHAAVQVTRLLDLQLVDVAAEPHELPRQLLVLHAHVCLRGGKQNSAVLSKAAASLMTHTCHWRFNVSVKFKFESSLKINTLLKQVFYCTKLLVSPCILSVF